MNIILFDISDVKSFHKRLKEIYWLKKLPQALTLTLKFALDGIDDIYK